MLSKNNKFSISTSVCLPSGCPPELCQADCRHGSGSHGSPSLLLEARRDHFARSRGKITAGRKRRKCGKWRRHAGRISLSHDEDPQIPQKEVALLVFGGVQVVRAFSYCFYYFFIFHPPHLLKYLGKGLKRRISAFLRQKSMCDNVFWVFRGLRVAVLCLWWKFFRSEIRGVCRLSNINFCDW